MGKSGRGVIIRFGTTALAEVKCLESCLGLFRVVFGDVARTEAVAALYEAMAFVVAQGACCGDLFH